jgi:hypothetical protein
MKSANNIRTICSMGHNLFETIFEDKSLPKYPFSEDDPRLEKRTSPKINCK